MNELLTDREKDLIILVASGKTNYEIAENLNISYGTVKKLLRKLFKIFNVQNRTQLVFATLKLLSIEYK
ncbi:MAG: helix-turn-helix transcriptional regulator [Candidatus Gastranaerophilales bacterium]|nr:helix-turn-helix transcriptional regulator [Candidatus Gastranaerophilales bacterium]